MRAHVRSALNAEDLMQKVKRRGFGSRGRGGLKKRSRLRGSRDAGKDRGGRCGRRREFLSRNRGRDGLGKVVRAAILRAVACGH